MRWDNHVTSSATCCHCITQFYHCLQQQQQQQQVQMANGCCITERTFNNWRTPIAAQAHTTATTSLLCRCWCCCCRCCLALSLWVMQAVCQLLAFRASVPSCLQVPAGCFTACQFNGLYLSANWQINIKSPWVKNTPPNFCPHLCQILTDFQNSLIVTSLCQRFAITWLLNITPHVNCIVTLRCETLMQEKITGKM